MSRVLKRLSLTATPLLLAGILILNLVAPAGADHEPANKLAAAGSVVMHVDGATRVLEETIRVSSPADLILQLTAECSIITQVTRGGTQAAEAEATGTVQLWIEIDGNRVPVSNQDVDPGQEGVQADNGEVVFCDRTHAASVTDQETDTDGTDELRDYQRTRHANAFNWLALDAGFNYDTNNDNLLDIAVYARYTRQGLASDPTFADAFVGKRTLIVEPDNASVHEEVQPVEEPAP